MQVFTPKDIGGRRIVFDGAGELYKLGRIADPLLGTDAVNLRTLMSYGGSGFNFDVLTQSETSGNTASPLVRQFINGGGVVGPGAGVFTTAPTTLLTSVSGTTTYYHTNCVLQVDRDGCQGDITVTISGDISRFSNCPTSVVIPSGTSTVSVPLTYDGSYVGSGSGSGALSSIWSLKFDAAGCSLNKSRTVQFQLPTTGSGSGSGAPSKGYNFELSLDVLGTTFSLKNPGVDDWVPVDLLISPVDGGTDTLYNNPSLSAGATDSFVSSDVDSADQYDVTIQATISGVTYQFTGTVEITPSLTFTGTMS